MKTRTELLNFLAKRYNLTRYLEIGVQNPENNFNHIECELKIGVDPELKTEYPKSSDAPARWIFTQTSDEYFSMRGDPIVQLDITSLHDDLPQYLKQDRRFDLIFIDGLHTAEQVRKDFLNANRFLKPDGFIVLHDCNPPEEQFTHVPRDTKVWYGDVYKLAVTISDRMKTTVDIDCGCCVVRPRNLNVLFRTTPETKNISWEYFNANRKTLLNLVSPEDFIKLHS